MIVWSSNFWQRGAAVIKAGSFGHVVQRSNSRLLKKDWQNRTFLLWVRSASQNLDFGQRFVGNSLGLEVWSASLPAITSISCCFTNDLQEQCLWSHKIQLPTIVRCQKLDRTGTLGPRSEWSGSFLVLMENWTGTIFWKTGPLVSIRPLTSEQQNKNT